MAGEDQERFEDYLELERYIEELQAGHAAHPPKDMTPEQASIYRMAALFRSAVPNAAEPHPDFADQLKARLLAGELETPAGQAQPRPTEIKPPLVASTPAASTAEPVKSTKKRVRFVSRRTLLAGGAVAAAASFAIGVGLDRTMGEQTESTRVGTTIGTTISTPTSSTIGLEGPTSWLFVTALADLGSNAIRFVSDAIIGYVVRDDTTANTRTTATPKIIAMSAACTHMGCIVRWEQADHQFHCPCHDALFTSQGEGVVHDRYTTPLPSLPRLNTKVVDGNIYVEVPAPKS